MFSRVNDEIEGAQALAHKSQAVISWAAVSAFRRLGVSFLLLALMMGAWVYYGHSIVEEAREIADKRTNQNQLLARKNGLLVSIGYLELCIGETAKTTEEQEYYCKRAHGNYKLELDPLELKSSKDIIKMNAYGAMKLILQQKVRLIDNDLKYDNSPSKQEELVTKFLSWFSFVGILFVILSVYCLVVYTLYKNRR